MTADDVNEQNESTSTTQPSGEVKVCGCPVTVSNRELTTITAGRMVFCTACNQRVA